MTPFTRVPAGISKVLPTKTGSETTATKGSPLREVAVPMLLTMWSRTCVPGTTWRGSEYETGAVAKRSAPARTADNNAFMNFLLPTRCAWANPLSWGDPGSTGTFPLAPRTRHFREEMQGGWGGTPSVRSVLLGGRKGEYGCFTEVLHNTTQFGAAAGGRLAETFSEWGNILE